MSMSSPTDAEAFYQFLGATLSSGERETPPRGMRMPAWASVNAPLQTLSTQAPRASAARITSSGDDAGGRRISDAGRSNNEATREPTRSVASGPGAAAGRARC